MIKFNRRKFINAVLFLARNGGLDVGKKKLAKLLYFVDFTLYEIRKKSLTEIPYVKKNYGPMPKPELYYKELGELKKQNLIKIEKPDRIGLEKIIAQQEADLKIFDKEEINILKQIAKKFHLETGGTLEKIAQGEPPYKMVNYEEEIPYHLAFYRNTFGEMDLNG